MEGRLGDESMVDLDRDRAEATRHDVAEAHKQSQFLAEGTFVGDYRIDGVLGAGGTAVVYAATHRVIGKRAAIKVMTRSLSSDEGALDRFVKEARLVNQIGHPNIV